MALSDCIKCWSTPCECGYESLDNNPQVLNRRRKDLEEFVEFLRDYYHIIIPIKYIDKFQIEQKNANINNQ